jgi:hypothetical protein
MSMQDGEARRDEEEAGSAADPETRPQRGGEAGTTRFGMEGGDNTDIPATGGPQAD